MWMSGLITVTVLADYKVKGNLKDSSSSSPWQSLFRIIYQCDVYQYKTRLCKKCPYTHNLPVDSLTTGVVSALCWVLGLLPSNTMTLPSLHAGLQRWPATEGSTYCLEKVSHQVHALFAPCGSRRQNASWDSQWTVQLCIASRAGLCLPGTIWPVVSTCYLTPKYSLSAQ